MFVVADVACYRDKIAGRTIKYNRVGQRLNKMQKFVME
jgi:hypothetical protein